MAKPLSLPATTENCPLLDPAGIDTEAGTVSAAWFPTMVTVNPVIEAAADSVTRHVAEACDASVVGLHVNPVSDAGAGGGGGAMGGGGSSVSAKS